ncbi:MAG: glycine zipper family protein [Stellaceae bacterium]
MPTPSITGLRRVMAIPVRRARPLHPALCKARGRGAAGGALIGAISGNAGRGAAIGAGFGALRGAVRRGSARSAGVLLLSATMPVAIRP